MLLPGLPTFDCIRSSVKELAKELGVSVDQIYIWCSEIKSDGSAASFLRYGIERRSATY